MSFIFGFSVNLRVLLYPSRSLKHIHTHTHVDYIFEFVRIFDIKWNALKMEKHGKSFSSLIKQYSTHFRSHSESCSMGTEYIYVLRNSSFFLLLLLWVNAWCIFTNNIIEYRRKLRFNKCVYVYHLRMCVHTLKMTMCVVGTKPAH